MRAVIAGGGIGGLTGAILLRSIGWEVTVLEQSPHIREVGAALVLHHSSVRLFRDLGLLDSMVAGAVCFTGMALKSANGTTILSQRYDELHRSYNPLRRTVIDVLHRAASAAGARLHTSNKVVGARPEGVLRTEDGEEHEADLVIGADGFHSRVREALDLTLEKRELRSGAIRTVFSRGEFDREDVFTEYWSGPCRMGVCPTGADSTYVYLSGPVDSAPARRVPVNISYWASRFPAAPKEFWERMEGGEALWNPYPYVQCRSWVNGRAAIVGDSAHATPPTLGQGVGLAVSNFARLARELNSISNRSQLRDALRRWEERSRPITESTQRWSLRYEALGSRWPAMLMPLRPTLIRLAKLKAIARHMNRADYEAPGAPTSIARRN